MTDSISRLLDAQIEQATQELKYRLDSEMWGSHTHSPRQTGKFDALVSTSFNEMVSKFYGPSMKQNLYASSPLLTAITQKQEKTMTDDTVIAREAVHKRKVARAEAAADTLFEYLDNIEVDDGSTISWTVVFADTPTTTYHYVAVRGGTRWYITGDSSKYSTDDLIEKIIGLALRGTVVVDEDMTL
jgi:hypothetical protein